MTQHPSLKSDQTGGKFRSVLKRHERIKEMADKEKWDEEKDSIFHLPKLKRLRFKVKKAKAAEEVEEGAVPAEGAEGAPGAPAGAPEQAAAGEEQAKPAADAGKKEEKKK